MRGSDQDRRELASAVRREFLQGATWLGGALVLGGAGALLTACSRNDEASTALARHNGPAPAEVSGRYFWKGDDGYETARQNAIWVGNKPKRYPALIVFPKTAAEVGAAVKFAKAQKLKVGVRSGGHSWTAAGVQDGSMLIDLFSWNQVGIDTVTKTALIGPGTQAGVLTEQLNKVGLAFPTAHAAHVSLGGYLLCGGFGWHSRHWGIGCENVLEVECVNAAGDVITANATTNVDFYWAARGSGPAFFGIVTRFKVQAHDLPKIMHERVDVYDMANWTKVITWTMEINNRIPSYVEPMVLRRRLDEKTGSWGADTFSVSWVAMADSAEQCREGLAMLDQCPAIRKRTNTLYREDLTLQALYDRSGGLDPWGWRYASDGVWTNADPKKLVPLMREICNTPTPRSYLHYAMWGNTRNNLPDMALTIQARSYVGAYVRWQDPADDQKMFEWTNTRIRRLAPLGVGSKMNDEAMVRRPARFFSEVAEKRLAELSARYDPDQLFLSFLKPTDQIY
jgi:FAD/FMN-containing dehydrogenase